MGLYHSGQVTANFGPHFRYPPRPEGIPAPRPVSDLNRVALFTLGTDQNGLPKPTKRRRCTEEARQFFF